MKNALHWAYNLPLQIEPVDDEPLTSPDKEYNVLLYMPRKGRIHWVTMSELRGEQTTQEYLHAAAEHLENLARLFRDAARGQRHTIYYPDEDMDKSILP